MKAVNKATFIPLAQVVTKLNPHIEIMNADGWELMFSSMEVVGLDENFILFWRKNVDDK